MAEVTMTFNGESRDYIRVLHGLERSAFAPITRELLDVPGVAGAYLTGTRTGVREVTVPIKIKGDDYSDLQALKEDLAGWLIHDEAKELSFSDEPNRTYLAVIEGDLNTEDIINHGTGEIKFLCPDPYKYGDEVSIDFYDSTEAINNGTAETKPVFELEVLEKSTFVMVQKGVDEYMMIGVPTDVDAELVDTRSLLIEETGTTLNLWDPAPPEIYAAEAVRAGSMAYDGSGIVPVNYGTGTRWHGPHVFLNVATTSDFEIELRGQLTSGIPQAGRFGFHALDDQMRHIGMMSTVDGKHGFREKVAEGRFGPFIGSHRNYPISPNNYKHKWDDFSSYVRLTRIGNTFEFYVARVLPNGTHTNKLTKLYTTTDEKYLGPLRYVSFFFNTYSTRQLPQTNRIDYLRVWKRNQATVDQTPYIVNPGDIVTFDHEERGVLVNGIDRTDLKDFGARYFSLDKGNNLISTYPPGALHTNIQYKERFK